MKIDVILTYTEPFFLHRKIGKTVKKVIASIQADIDKVPCKSPSILGTSILEDYAIAIFGMNWTLKDDTNFFGHMILQKETGNTLTLKKVR